MCAMKADRGTKVLLMLALVLAALSLPVALVVLGVSKMWQEHNAAVPSVEMAAALRASAERAADAVLPVPTLGGGSAESVECLREKLDAELQRIVRLATGVGGSASFWKDDSTVRVVASVPSSAETIFRDAVRRGVYDVAMSGPTKPSVVVEVVVRAGSAKPSR